MSTQFSFDHLFSGKPLSPPLKAEEYLPPRSRKTDAPSSHRAEAELRRSGALRGQTKMTLELVKQYPGKTSKQLSSLGTLDRYVLAKRLADLRKMHLVHSSQIGSDDFQWWPA